MAVKSEQETTEPSKRELQRQMQRTRESLAETVNEIKDTVDEEYRSVKRTVSGVLDYREQFKDEPLVWSLGALSGVRAWIHGRLCAQKFEGTQSVAVSSVRRQYGRRTFHGGAEFHNAGIKREDSRTVWREFFRRTQRHQQQQEKACRQNLKEDEISQSSR